jgi:hypothetical protein
MPGCQNGKLAFMSATLLSAGIACIIAAVIGGGLKAFGIEIPVFPSLQRQVMLAILGVILVVASFHVPNSNDRKDLSSRADSSTQALPEKAQQPRAAQQQDKGVGSRPNAAGVTLTYDGVVDALRQENERTFVHTPNNNENRGHCQNEVGHQDGKYCTSRTPLTMTTTAPYFYNNVRVTCNGAGCPWTSVFGTPTVTKDGLTATGYLDNWGSDVDAILLADRFEHLDATRCGPEEALQLRENVTFLLTVSKDCLQIATLKWVLSDGSQGALPVGSSSSPGGEVVLVGSPLDRGTQTLYSYKLTK